MRSSVLLMTGAAALAASAAFAQTSGQVPTAPQTATPQTTVPQGTVPPAAPADPVPADAPAPPAPAPAATVPAQTVPTTATTLIQPAVGVTVFDPAGAKVGTIKAVAQGFATLSTAKGDVRLAVASIGPGPNGAVIGGTAAEIEAAAAKAAAAQPATPARAAPRSTRRR